MNKRLENKYLLVKRLLEIEILVNKKYGISENVQADLSINPGSKENEVIIDLDPFSKLFGTKESKYTSLINDYNNDELTKDYLDIILYQISGSKNDGISPDTEEFWEIVDKEKLKFKRKNNRLMNILKKGYVGGFDDREIFYREINNLLASEIFQRKYGEEIKLKIINLIDEQKNRLISQAEKIIKMKNVSEKNYYKLDDIITQFVAYSDVLKIPSSQLMQWKNELTRIKADL